MLGKEAVVQTIRPAVLAVLAVCAVLVVTLATPRRTALFENPNAAADDANSWIIEVRARASQGELGEGDRGIAHRAGRSPSMAHGVSARPGCLRWRRGRGAPQGPRALGGRAPRPGARADRVVEIRASECPRHGHRPRGSGTKPVRFRLYRLALDAAKIIRGKYTVCIHRPKACHNARRQRQERGMSGRPWEC